MCTRRCPRPKTCCAMEALEMVGRQTVTSVHFLFPMCLCQQYLSSLLRYKVLDRRRTRQLLWWCLRSGIGNCYIILFRMLSLVLQSFGFSLMLVTMVLRCGSLVQWFGMLQPVERRMVTARSTASDDFLPNHTCAAFPGQSVILIFLSFCWHADRLDRSSRHHSLRRLSF